MISTDQYKILRLTPPASPRNIRHAVIHAVIQHLQFKHRSYSDNAANTKWKLISDQLASRNLTYAVSEPLSMGMNKYAQNLDLLTYFSQCLSIIVLYRIGKCINKSIRESVYSLLTYSSISKLMFLFFAPHFMPIQHLNVAATGTYLLETFPPILAVGLSLLSQACLRQEGLKFCFVCFLRG